MHANQGGPIPIPPPMPGPPQMGMPGPPPMGMPGQQPQGGHKQQPGGPNNQPRQQNPMGAQGGGIPGMRMHQIPPRVPTYEGWKLQKIPASALGPGETPSWSRCNKTHMPVSEAELASLVKEQKAKARRKGRTVMDEYSALTSGNMRSQIDRLIEEKNRDEFDQAAEWKLEGLRVDQRRVSGLGRVTQITGIQVILKRQSPSAYRYNAFQTAGLAGTVVDLAEPIDYVRQPQLQPGQQRPGGQMQSGPGFGPQGQKGPKPPGMPGQGPVGIPQHGGNGPPPSPPPPPLPMGDIFPATGKPKPPKAFVMDSDDEGGRGRGKRRGSKGGRRDGGNDSRDRDRSEERVKSRDIKEKFYPPPMGKYANSGKPRKDSRGRSPFRSSKSPHRSSAPYRDKDNRRRTKHRFNVSSCDDEEAERRWRGDRSSNRSTSDSDSSYSSTPSPGEGIPIRGHRPKYGPSGYRHGPNYGPNRRHRQPGWQPGWGRNDDWDLYNDARPYYADNINRRSAGAFDDVRNRPSANPRRATWDVFAHRNYIGPPHGNYSIPPQAPMPPRPSSRYPADDYPGYQWGDGKKPNANGGGKWYDQQDHRRHYDTQWEDGFDGWGNPAL